MKILADFNIPGIEDLCRPLGEVVMFDARDRAMLRQNIAHADVLLCRSTIHVDKVLLAGTPVRFVATATAGVDHVDTEWLASQGIAFASAAGSNARSVAEYVFAALFTLSSRGRIMPVRSLSLGIVGAGHVGSQVASIAKSLGLAVVLNDPPLRDLTGSDEYRPLDEALSCDVVSLHVPLTDTGSCPTREMIDSDALSRMRPTGLLVNAARGGVVQEPVVMDAAERHIIGGFVTDVFTHEPVFDADYASRAAIATPHIAGHAWDGKLRGTAMVHAALCDFLGVPRQSSPASTTPAAELTIPEALFHDDAEHSGVQDPDVLINAAIRCAYDIAADDAALRNMLQLSDEERGRAFASHRAEYPIRREFGAFTLPPGATVLPDVYEQLLTLGFSEMQRAASDPHHRPAHPSQDRSTR